MIHLTYSEISHYFGLSKNLDKALEYLQKNSLDCLGMGRNEVDGEQVYINRFGYTTARASELTFEAHEEYVDIHVLLSGEERIDIANIDDLTEFEADKATDYIGYKGKEQITVAMTCADILVVFPKEAHRVKVQLAEPTKVEKAVFKVKI